MNTKEATTLHTLQLPQGPIRYLDSGSGPAVVFVHGLMVDHRVWLPVIRELGPHWRCIAPDWPLGAHRQAMEASADLSVPGMAGLIADFIAALGLSDVVLVGNDTGGALAQMVVARAPGRIGRLVLTTCDAYEVFPPPSFRYLKMMGLVPGAAWMGAQLMHHLPLLQRLPFTFGDVTDGPLSPALVRSWLEPMRHDAGVRRDVCKFAATLQTRHTEEAALGLRGAGRPLTLLWSQRCHHFPARLAQRLAGDIPDAELRWVDSAGVFLSLEYAPQVADAIRPARARCRVPQAVYAR